MVAAEKVRAIVCNEYGEPESLVMGEIDRPKVQTGQVLVRVRKAGINFPDTLIIKGQYQVKPPIPFAPGFEVAGEVIALNGVTTDLRIGDRVVGLTSSGYGGFAEEAVVDENTLVKVPDNLDLSSAMALLTAYGTSYHALVQRGGLQRDETLVVLGASGSVGLAAVDIGKALGARVIAVGRSLARLSLAAGKGADELLSYEEPDFKQRLLKMTGGSGADVCLDTLGGQAFNVMSRSMNWNGRLLVVGFTSGQIPSIPVNLVLLKGYQLIGVWWAQSMKNNPGENRSNFHDLFRMLTEGLIMPLIADHFPLRQVPDALRALLSRTTSGKIIIDVG